MAGNKRFEVTQSQGKLDVIRIIKDTEDLWRRSRNYLACRC
jgi:hypothetical protein